MARLRFAMAVLFAALRAAGTRCVPTPSLKQSSPGKT